MIPTTMSLRTADETSLAPVTDDRRLSLPQAQRTEPDLPKRYLGLGLEDDILRHARLAPPLLSAAQSSGRYRR
jgi:hypothetical protein